MTKTSLQARRAFQMKLTIIKHKLAQEKRQKERLAKDKEK